MVDTHSHINSVDFRDVQFEIDFINSLMYLDSIINVGMDLRTSSEAVYIGNNNSKFYSTLGIHPLYDGNVGNLFQLYMKSPKDKIVAVGETGLDSNGDIYSQRIKFIEQIELANRLELPLIIHSNNANREVINILKSHYPRFGFVFHCFQPDIEIAQEIVNMGGFLSFASPITKPNAVRSLEVIKTVPIDRILIELDYPYMSINPTVDGRNIFNKLRELRGLTYIGLERQLDSNARRLFRNLI